MNIIIFIVAGHLLYTTGGDADVMSLLEKYASKIGTFHFKASYVDVGKEIGAIKVNYIYIYDTYIY